jgi:hypothetical protein
MGDEPFETADDPPSDDPPSFRFTSNYSAEFDPYYYRLGCLALEWAEFEFNINNAIWELANVSRMAGTCMTSQLIGPAPRFRCLVSLLNLRETPQELVKAINSLSGEAEGLGRRRNRYLHDPMVLNVDDRKIYRMETTADRTITHEIIGCDTGEIDKLIEEIRRVEEKFDDLFDDVLAKTPPWPRTQYEQSKGIRLYRKGPSSAPSTPAHPPEPSAG